MQDTIRTQRVFYLGTAIATLIATVLRALSLTLAFDRTTGYFKAGAALPLCYQIFTAACLLACILFPLLALKNRVPQERAKRTLHSTCGAGLCALLCFLNFIAACMQTSELLSPFLRLLGLLSLLAATVYFILQATPHKIGVATTAVLGCLTIVALACLISFSYFDVATPMNAPHKTDPHVALLAIMLYLLYELRATAGIPLPRALTACTALAFLLSVTVGFSDLVAYLAGIYTAPTYLAQDLLLIAAAIYIGARGAADCRVAA